MEPLNPIREGYVTRLDNTPGPRGIKPFPAIDDGPHGIPAAPPPEVLDALDRAARVMTELGRKNVTVALESAATGPLRVMLHHPGTASRELSHHALLNLLDGDTSIVAGLA